MKTTLFALIWGELVGRVLASQGNGWFHSVSAQAQDPSVQHLDQRHLVHRAPDGFPMTTALPHDRTVSAEATSNTFWKYTWNYNMPKKQLSDLPTILYCSINWEYCENKTHGFQVMKLNRITSSGRTHKRLALWHLNIPLPNCLHQPIQLD